MTMTVQTTKIDAPCKGQFELFESTRRSDHLLATVLCQTCPIFDECDELRREMLAANAIINGTWAGRLYIQHGVEVLHPEHRTPPGPKPKSRA